LAINAKGGELIGPKQKDRTTTHFIFQIFKNNFTKGKKSFQLQNPLDSEGENFFRGSFYLAKGKAFETGGEFSKS
jgi:hypothetical protein